VSVAGDIADAAVDAIDSLALTGVTVAKRKTPSVPEGMALPLVVVSVAEEGDSEYVFAGKVVVTYPEAVTIVTANASPLQENGTIRTWREAIRKKLEDRTSWSAVAEFNDLHSGGKEPYDRAALAKDLNYSSLIFRVEALEDRT
jgi:hypothetical protein